MKDLSVGEHLLPGIKSKAIDNVEVTILAEGCSGLSNGDHEAALKVMECCQCTVVRNSAEVA